MTSGAASLDYEGGADAAVALLRHYDRAVGAWKRPMVGHLWGCIESAWSRGRTGNGISIAVIDDGFDTTVPALSADTELPFGVPHRGRHAHGTAVSLMIRAVAPDARLLLYPAASSAAGWSLAAVIEALQHVRGTDAVIVNLSLGAARKATEVERPRRYLEDVLGLPLRHIPRHDEETFSDVVRALDWKHRYEVPPSRLGNAAQRLATEGRTVVAAAGNEPGHLYDPACRAGVLAVGAHAGRLHDPATFADHLRYRPAVYQNEFSDLVVLQPPRSVGSSFAAPLITGLAALMKDRRDLDLYREAEMTVGLGVELIGDFFDQGFMPWSSGAAPRVAVIDRLMRFSSRLPHEHADMGITCPECSYFLLPTYLNFAGYKVETSCLDEADDLLSTAGSFAPDCADVPLIQGRISALRASSAGVAGETSRATSLLTLAQQQLRAGLAIQDNFPRSQRLLSSITQGLEDPSAWMAPEEAIPVWRVPLQNPG